MALTQQEILELRQKVGLDQPRTSSRMQRLRNIAENQKSEQERPTRESSSLFRGKEKGKIEKGLERVGEGFGKVADFFFGSTAKSIGGLLVGAIESAQSLAGEDVGERKGFDVGGRSKNKVKAGDIAFTVLELYPGGGQLARIFKKIPGGAKIAEKFSNQLTKIPPLLRQSAISRYIKALAPTKSKFKRLAERVAPGLAERRIVIKNLDDFAKKAGNKVDEIGQKIDNAWENLPKEYRVEAEPILNRLEDYKKGFIVDGVSINKNAIQLIDEMQEVILQLGDSVDPKSLRKLRQILDKNKDFSKFATDGTRQAVEREFANSIREVLAKDIPEIGKLNKEFNFWKNVSDIVEETIQRKKPQVGGLSRLVGSVGGGIAGFQEGGLSFQGLKNAAIGAIIGERAIGILRSPRFRTVSAKIRTQIADAIAEGNYDLAVQIINRTIAGLEND